MIFDTHCHYNLSPLKENWQSHWAKAKEHGVEASVIVGTDSESCTTAVAIADSDPNLFASIGQHPGNYHQLVKTWLSSTSAESDFDGMIAHDLQQLQLLLSEKVVAIGETGLDYYWLPEDGTERSVSIALQQEAFSAHIQLSNETGLPLVIHVRDKADGAYWDTLDLLEQKEGDLPFILHCASGPKEYLEQAIGMGAYLGFAGNVTYSSASSLRELVRNTPTERILLETDAPYLPPQQHRGKQCEPWMISQTAQFLSELGIKEEQTYQNALEVYNLELSA